MLSNEYCLVRLYDVDNLNIATIIISFRTLQLAFYPLMPESQKLPNSSQLPHNEARDEVFANHSKQK